MKTKSVLTLCLALLLLWVALPTDARAQTAATLHLFYGIPLDTATPESAAQTLKEQTGAELSAPNATDTQYYAEDVPWLGKTFGCMVEFYSKNPASGELCCTRRENHLVRHRGRVYARSPTISSIISRWNSC